MEGQNDFTRKNKRPLRPGYLLLMFCRSKNQGGSSWKRWQCNRDWKLRENFMLGAVVSSVHVAPQQLQCNNYFPADDRKLFQLSQTLSKVTMLLLQRHNIQLQHGGPHQPLFIVEVRPGQRLMRQAPQALHEGSITFIQTWDAGKLELGYWGTVYIPKQQRRWEGNSSFLASIYWFSGFRGLSYVAQW